MIEEPNRATWPAVVATDLAGRVAYWNAAAEQLLGWLAADAVGQLVRDLDLVAEEPSGLARILEQVRGGDAWQGRLALRNRDGRTLEVATVALPIVDGRGELAGIVAMSVAGSAGAEARAQIAADRLARLQRISAALSRSQSTDGVSDVILAELVAEVGVSRRALWLLDGQGGLRLVRAVGSDLAALFSHLALDTDLPAAVAVRTGTAVFVESAEQGRRLFPATGDHNRGSYATLPLLVGGEAIGALGLGYDAEYRFDPDERQFLRAIADQAAQAIDRVRLLERETRAAGRLAFLAHASVVLASSLDLEETLARIVRLVVPSVADLATVHLYDDGRVLRRAALAHRDPAVEANLNGQVDGLGDESSRMQEVADDMRRGVLLLPRPVDLLPGAVEIGSTVAVPLIARGATLGILSLMRTGDSPPFEATDADFAEEVGRRAAIAIDNARLRASRVSVLRALQRSLLPPRLPVVPHLDLAAAYHPVAEGMDVGGDFYDVFALTGDDWVVTIGDVCGTGPEAAARTAQVRHTVRALARAGLRGSEVVGGVNAALLADGSVDGLGERFCTLLYGEAHVGPAGVDLDLVCAGHPKPIVVRGGGQVVPVACGGGLVGVFDEVAAEGVRVRLDPGDAIVFITDGIVEARAAAPAESGFRALFDDERLHAALREAAGADAAAQVAAVEKAVLTFSGGTLADDAAVLVVRSSPG
jgi:PAS domain S-box-containing protein